ncbi:MAG: 7,8-didemethyl-8-hydroxy-5-deazariboflavin synthase subunit CofG [Methanosphaera stadtmanae]|nr:7,8-didemethyl-8-hydroxy-5-deazariboflavin synthase subunit CofG [Methanosphaera stadtmanae]
MDFSRSEIKTILDYDLIDLFDLIKKINIERKIHEITYSKNIFLPLTHICKNNCGYCTFKQSPEEASFLLMNKQDVFKQLHEANKYNCTEALFTFGEDADEVDVIKDKLSVYGYDSMVDYVYDLSNVSLNKYNVLPHTNMGIISRNQIHRLKKVNASMGLMLETTNKHLLKTIVHKDSPGKNPDKRIKMISDAGKEKIPFTTGLLIGIGESHEDHLDSLFKLRQLQDKYGHIQEIIIQNFKPKLGIPMENYPEPPIIDLIKLTLVSHIMFPDISIQIPPNLNRKLMSIFAIAGADDIGGISPITMDYVNPDAPWPKIEELKLELDSINYSLVERLPVYNKYINRTFLSPLVYDKVIQIKKEYNIR